MIDEKPAVVVRTRDCGDSFETWHGSSASDSAYRLGARCIIAHCKPFHDINA